MEIEYKTLCKTGSYLLGTCMPASAAIAYFDLDIDESFLEDKLLTLNIEKCLGCDWWCESWELVDEDYENPGFCEDCRSK